MILRVLLGYTLNKTIGSSATVVAAPKMSVFIDHDIQNWKRVRSGNMRHSSIPCGPRQGMRSGWSYKDLP